MPRAPILAVAVVLAAVLAACGRDRQDPSGLTFEATAKTSSHAYPRAGLRFRLPSNAVVRAAAAPGVFRAFIGDGFLAGFAYRRAEQLPRNQRELAAARRRLERTTKERNSSYRVLRSRTTRVAGARAVELLGDQRISNERLRTRSLHVYKGSAEYVFELGVPVEDFARLDSAIFPVLRDTLKVSGTVRRR